jgi:hypothetical protein
MGQSYEMQVESERRKDPRGPRKRFYGRISGTTHELKE